MHSHTSVVSADKTSVVSAVKTSVVSKNKTSVVSQDIPQALPTQGRPLRGRPCVENVGGMSWEMSADTTDVLSADTTDVLAADTTDVLSADTSLQSGKASALRCVASKTQHFGINFGISDPFGMSGVQNQIFRN